MFAAVSPGEANGQAHELGGRRWFEALLSRTSSAVVRSEGCRGGLRRRGWDGERKSEVVVVVVRGKEKGPGWNGREHGRRTLGRMARLGRSKAKWKSPSKRPRTAHHYVQLYRSTPPTRSAPLQQRRRGPGWGQSMSLRYFGRPSTQGRALIAGNSRLQTNIRNTKPRLSHPGVSVRRGCKRSGVATVESRSPHRGSSTGTGSGSVRGRLHLTLVAAARAKTLFRCLI